MFVLFFFSFKRVLEKAKSDDTSVTLATFTVPHFIAYTFSRGVHIQFFMWLSPTLPFVLTTMAGMSTLGALTIHLLMDWSHSWTANVIQVGEFGKVLEALQDFDIGTAMDTLLNGMFTQLRSVPETAALLEPNTRFVEMVGAYFRTSFSMSTIPASFVLFSLEVIVLVNIFSRIRAWRKKKGEHKNEKMNGSFL
eukprot:TRINITY_DN2168_c0_g1_i1.p1 TRINITY_DN2168_c0_g1~~TRINITY_DN2168_c0_g1_i1.p1  ORF type:complete len:194 (+),score=48.40 TRINITY_DN2168_c0_g1_i1:364-945(+)